MKPKFFDISQIKDPKELQRFTALNFQDLKLILGGNVSFADNFNGKFVGMTFLTANANTTITHGLNRIPNGYLRTSATTAMTLYDGSVAATSTTITLKSSATGFCNIFIF